jgi:hypothetical protein
MYKTDLEVLTGAVSDMVRFFAAEERGPILAVPVSSSTLQLALEKKYCGRRPGNRIVGLLINNTAYSSWKVSTV